MKLTLRVIVANVAILAIALAAWNQGWFDHAIETDKYHLIKINVGVFILGLILVGVRLQGLARTSSVDATKLRMAAGLANVRYIANSIVMIGLIGTIIGFIIALRGVNAEAATDSSAITPMISTLLLGMAIALYKTLIGSALNMWLMLNHRMLEAASARLILRGRHDV